MLRLWRLVQGCHYINVHASLDSHVDLIFTPLTNLLHCGWIVSTTAQFTGKNKDLSNMLCYSRCYGLQPLLTIMLMIMRKKTNFNVQLYFLEWLRVLSGVQYFADLSLFSTKTLVETNGDHQVEVRTQVKLVLSYIVWSIVSKAAVSRVHVLMSHAVWNKYHMLSQWLSHCPSICLLLYCVAAIH